MDSSLYKKLENRSIDADRTILAALKQMDRIDRKLLLVFEKERFVNVLSIGDIQRAIIRNVDLETPVRYILRENTNLARHTDTLQSIKQKMLDRRIECMPVLDDKGSLVDVYFWEDLFKGEKRVNQVNLGLPVVIMAGGKGTRMKPLTNILPKPLIPINEKTILENIMDRFTEIGCTKFYISVNYKYEIIEHYFNSLNESIYDIHYFREAKPLGTAGSLFLLKDAIKETFFVSNCDIIINDDYSRVYDYHFKHKNELTIVAALKHYAIPYGIIETGSNGELKKLKEKPEFTFQINSGLYILEPHLLNEIPPNEFFHITSLIEKIKKRNGRVGVFPVSEGSWSDYGNWQEYLQKVRVYD